MSEPGENIAPVLADEENNDYPEEVYMYTLQRRDRTIHFAVAGSGTPVLYLYPGGCNRRILALLHKMARRHKIRFICVNRPGRGTCSASAPKEDDTKRSAAYHHVETAARDMVAVLDALKIQKVGVFFHCAGTPFALVFASRFPERIEGSLMGAGSWVQPADCPDTKPLFRFGATKTPLWLTSYLASGIASSVEFGMFHMPTQWMSTRFGKHLSKEEKQAFADDYDATDFVEKFKWMQKEGAGMTPADLTTLLSPASDIGLEYSQLTIEVKMVHAQNDKVTPAAAAEWMAKQLPACDLTLVDDGTHEGSLFNLHDEIHQVLEALTQ
mmetsp:Transcript_10090/g.16749  ORF Transcript_10090/g.16749 Transcript_10090/m.16749 type:complete len:326 (-) Transcript_10090:132-1109(-)|eukprot:CAMPEP_0119018570 /NCGR_PEP_ID=MMETSP1176-20130426/19742_1 /TAXON_ID=265551 /ORGANISM="Synedropsis recta cf, Strain CCMP1620" /LENGTH=325 /DNA_ID=CAMNT_0006972599 /DNA_START=114 /DNA_END=1091 /DNA_ORIENTATION=-